VPGEPIQPGPVPRVFPAGLLSVALAGVAALKATLARATSLGRGRITSWPATRRQTAAPIIQL
jgi:hypothetical protein